MSVCGRYAQVLNVGYFGEILVCEKPVTLISFDFERLQDFKKPKFGILGTMQITNYAIIFQSQDKERFASLRVPLGNVSCINIPKHGVYILVECKDVRVIGFEFMSANDRNSVYQYVTFLAFNACVDRSFPFQFRDQTVSMSKYDDGWLVYDPMAEYRRLGIFVDGSSQAASAWRFTEANNKFQLCDSYPKLLIAPVGVGDAELEASASFRY